MSSSHSITCHLTTVSHRRKLEYLCAITRRIKVLTTNEIYGAFGRVMFFFVYDDEVDFSRQMASLEQLFKKTLKQPPNASNQVQWISYSQLTCTLEV